MALERAGVAALSPPVGAVAVTSGPGLMGALLVGLSAAKGLAMSWGVPFVGVNHLEGHLFATLLEAGGQVEYPLVVLLVSGGHTLLVVMHGPGDYRLLGQTLDDAAGEAYDKVARYLGLGYPGGPAIDRIAPDGDPATFAFPRALLDQGYDFSFSGLKTAVVRAVERDPSVSTVDVAAAFQEAVVDVLVTKSLLAVREVGASALCLAGGVAANSLLRAPRLRRPRPTACGAWRRAWPCARTTRRWWQPPAGGGCCTTGRVRGRSVPTPTWDCPWPGDSPVWRCYGNGRRNRMTSAAMPHTFSLRCAPSASQSSTR